MSNIEGGPFEPYVKKQIEIRQKSLGQKNNISADNLKYYTTKTPWLRLASSVDLTGDEGDNSVLNKLASLGISRDIIKNTNLAKKLILQGGALTLEETEDDQGKVISSKVKLNKGLNYSNEIFNGAYGWGGVNERGYVPMPGIEKCQSTYYNDGVLSKATISIKCFSRTQFALLDVLYLRPGYSLLLEFGWSTFLNNEGNLEEFNSFKSEPLSFLLKPGSFPGRNNQFQMYQLIAQERLRYSGNYEAIFGVISNFKWSFDSDGSYNCEVTLTGVGDVINSLKLNVTDPKKDGDGKSSIEQTEVELEDFIIQFLGETIAFFVNDGTEGSVDKMPKYFKKQMNRILRDYDTNVDTNSPIKEIRAFLEEQRVLYNERNQAIITHNNSSNPVLTNKDDTKLNKIFYNIAQQFSEESDFSAGMFKDFRGIKNGCFLLDNTYVGEMKLDGGGAKKSKSVYIKFGALLKILENNANLFSIIGGRSTPMLKFDFNYANLKNDDNFMLIIPPNISTQPQKCLTPNNVMGFKDVVEYDYELPIDSELNTTLMEGQNFLVENNPFVGRLGNMLINLRFASSAISELPKNNDGSISVIEYLKKILAGINSSMGSINDFTPVIDQYDGTIKIYDKSPKPGLVENKPDEFSTINIFGVKNNQGSFVTSVGLNAEIGEDFATIITIGAQSSGNNLMGNSTSFSNYNEGLIDRILPQKLDSTQLAKPEVSRSASPVEQIYDIKTKKLYYQKDNNKISPIASMYLREGIPYSAGSGGESFYNFTTEVSNDLTENYTTYLHLVRGELAKNNVAPAPFFLPFNLTLEMEGLSGMKLYEKFKMTDDILPPSYDGDNIEIKVTGINHTVDIKTWSTQINTLSVPSFKPVTLSGSLLSDPPKKEDEPDKPSATTDEPQNEFEVYVDNTPWSAVFISYVVGIKAATVFPNSAAHADYAQQVRKGTSTFQNNPGGFPPYDWVAIDPNTSPVEVGDIVITNRSTNTGTKEEPNFVKNTLTYQSPVWTGPTHGDIVTKVINNSSGVRLMFQAEIIGGNVKDSVTKKTISLKGAGYLKRNKFFTILRINKGQKNPDGTYTKATDVAYIAKQEHSNFGGRDELDFSVRDILYNYYLSAPETKNQVPKP